MALSYFNDHDFMAVSESLDIAEDKTGSFYKFSFGQWKRHHYDVKTLSSLRGEEVSDHAFALLNRRARGVSSFDLSTKKRDFYYICLQDHQILKALKRDKSLRLLPLLVYILTHELVHIVRFCNFFQRFDVTGAGREREEQVVHATTFEILKDVCLPQLDYVLDVYHRHRICELGHAEGVN